MGLRVVHMIECDGPGCDLGWQGEDLTTVPDHFTQPQTIQMKNQVLWSGYLCKSCEEKVYNALVGAIPRK